MASRPIITLTTDFGPGPFVAVMKGVMAGICPQARFIDVSHQVPPQDVAAGAAVLEWTLSHFPKGTVHLAVVDPGVGAGRRGIVAACQGQFWLGPDNGLLTPVLASNPEAALHEITEQKYFLNPVSHTFHGRDVFAPVAAHLALGVGVARFGGRVENPVLLPKPRPVLNNGSLQGVVVSADGFGNLATNLSRQDVEDFLAGAPGRVEVAGCEIDGIFNTYAKVLPGDPLALFDSLGRLELAVNQGSMLLFLGFSQAQVKGLAVTITRR